MTEFVLKFVKKKQDLKTNKLLVSVLLITYNHEKYIRQSIESIIGQITDFNFEIVVGEDHSTDNTFSIIQSYQKANPELIRIRRSAQNVGLLENYKLTTEACKGKYIAICSGDDYWIDNYKLQKQLDFLESNDEYGLCYTDFSILNTKTNKIIKSHHSLIEKRIFDRSAYEALLLNTYIGAITVCIRSSLVKEYFSFIGNDYYNFQMEDKPLWLFTAYQSKIHFINEQTAMYRKVPDSVSNPKENQKKLAMIKSVTDVSLYFINRLGASNSIKEEVELRYYKGLLAYSTRFKLKAEGKKAYIYLKSKNSLSFKDAVFYSSMFNPILFFFLKFVRAKPIN